MKTKITFFLTALLITLFSVNANAQSNTTPIKGDVNGDGVVDVADINAIIAIMKNGGGTVTEYTWYKGLATEQEIQTQSYIDGLSLNQTTKPTETITMQKGYNVCIFPESWGIPTIYEDAGHTFEWTPYSEKDLGITSPTGKRVLVWESPSDVTMYIVWPEFTWYKGMATEQEIQTQSYIDGLSLNQTTKPTETITMQKGYNVMLFPSSWGVPTFWEDTSHTFEAGTYDAAGLGINNPTGFNVVVYESYSESLTLYVEWK